MSFWLKNMITGKIVCAFRVPKGYSATQTVLNWLEQNKITDKENYKVLYKNPFNN